MLRVYNSPVPHRVRIGLIVALALKNDPREGLWRWPYPALIILSAAVNVWGVWWWQTQRG